jgi:hypothetical protein
MAHDLYKQKIWEILNDQASRSMISFFFFLNQDLIMSFMMVRSTIIIWISSVSCLTFTSLALDWVFSISIPASLFLYHWSSSRVHVSRELASHSLLLLSCHLHSSMAIDSFNDSCNAIDEASCFMSYLDFLLPLGRTKRFPAHGMVVASMLIIKEISNSMFLCMKGFCYLGDCAIATTYFHLNIPWSLSNNDSR